LKPERPVPGIFARRSANRSRKPEMLPLPAFVPGIFICSSKRFAAAPFPPKRDQRKRLAQESQPGAKKLLTSRSSISPD
jgi:hypothetical protein